MRMSRPSASRFRTARAAEEARARGPHRLDKAPKMKQDDTLFSRARGRGVYLPQNSTKLGARARTGRADYETE